MDARNVQRRETNRYIKQNCTPTWTYLRDYTGAHGQQIIKKKKREREREWAVCACLCRTATINRLSLDNTWTNQRHGTGLQMQISLQSSSGLQLHSHQILKPAIQTAESVQTVPSLLYCTVLTVLQASTLILKSECSSFGQELLQEPFLHQHLQVVIRLFIWSSNSTKQTEVLAQNCQKISL